MKVRKPKSCFDLRIRKRDLVLDVGSGNNPHPRADVLLERHLLDNTHRSGPIKILKGQKFVEYKGGRFPFKTDEFDYVICSHVLEHVDAPDFFLSELSRVGSKDYIETPSLIGEYLIPKESHKWVVLEIDEKLVVVKKKEIPYKSFFGDLFQKYVSPYSIEFRIFQQTYKDLFTVRYEWRDGIDYVVNPENKYLRDFFGLSLE